MHELMKLWFERVLDWGYLGVFFLMTLESTIVPIPSEVILPPAAYWAAQGKMHFWLLVLIGAAGSTFGSSLTYWFSRTAGRAFLLRYGKWFLLGPDKLALAEAWVADYAVGGVFFARLLPVLRHLIGFPAGLVGTPFPSFVAATFTGSFVWSTVLCWVGAKTIGQRPDLLTDPDALEQVLRHDMVWFLGLVLLVGCGWVFVQWYGARAKRA